MDNQNSKQNSDKDPNKKESSYHYWVKDDVQFYKGVEKPCSKPKPVQAHEVQKVQKKGVSSWNKVGTWEQKHFDVADLQEFLKHREITFADDEYRVSKIKNLTGELSCVMVRGKKKCGYELKFEVEVEKGTQFISIKFDEFNEYSDHEYDICVGTISKSTMEDVFDDFCEEFAKCIKEFVDQSLEG